MSFAVEAAKRPYLKVVNESRLPPTGERFDLRAELLTVRQACPDAACQPVLRQGDISKVG
jgi:hypothetical protein